MCPSQINYEISLSALYMKFFTSIFTKDKHRFKIFIIIIIIFGFMNLFIFLYLQNFLSDVFVKMIKNFNLIFSCVHLTKISNFIEILLGGKNQFSRVNLINLNFTKQILDMTKKKRKKKKKENHPFLATIYFFNYLMLCHWLVS
jgi:hypothetical protein